MPKPRDKRRVMLGIGLVLMGFGVLARYFEPPRGAEDFTSQLIVILIRAAVYGGAVIAVAGAAAIMRDEASSDRKQS